jgi:hypothetical protein
VPLNPTQPIQLGRDAISLEPEEDGAPPVGFAEALFGAGTPRTSPVPLPLFSESVEMETEYDEGTFLDGPLPGLDDRHPGDYDPALDEPPPPPHRFLLWMFVILVAAALAGVAAHLSGTAFWQR